MILQEKITNHLDFTFNKTKSASSSILDIHFERE